MRNSQRGLELLEEDVACRNPNWESPLQGKAWLVELVKVKLLLLSHFSRVRLCATPWTAAHKAPPSLGFSRQEHWSGLPFPSPMHESEKSKWSRSVVSNSSQPHGLQPTRLLRPWDFPGKSTGVGCHCLLPEGEKSLLNSLSKFLEDLLCNFRHIISGDSHSSHWEVNVVPV